MATNYTSGDPPANIVIVGQVREWITTRYTVVQQVGPNAWRVDWGTGGSHTSIHPTESILSDKLISNPPFVVSTSEPTVKPMVVKIGQIWEYALSNNKPKSRYEIISYDSVSRLFMTKWSLGSELLPLTATSILDDNLIQDVPAIPLEVTLSKDVKVIDFGGDPKLDAAEMDMEMATENLREAHQLLKEVWQWIADSQDPVQCKGEGMICVAMSAIQDSIQLVNPNADQIKEYYKQED